MLTEKCSQVPNVAYLQPESDCVMTNTELEMTCFDKDELQLIDGACELRQQKIERNYK